ncbi:MAG: amidohydrolase [Caldilineales bacterium]
MPDLILFNGNIWTQDPATPSATAVAIRAGRFLAAGGDEEIRALRTSRTQQIDLGGRRVLPGLTDAHFHFRGWAMGRKRLRLAGMASLAAVVEAVAAAAQGVRPGQWIRGQGWNETNWPEARFPTRHDLDAVAPDTPVYLLRSDLHLAVANSAVLRLAGIDAATPDPTAGVIDRDAAGQPTGVLRDEAMKLVDAVIPHATAPEVDAAMRDAIAAAHRLGLTGIHDFRSTGISEGQTAWATWQRLWSRDQLNLRVWSHIAGDALDAAVDLGLRTGFGDDRLRMGGIKLFADGSLGARTAWMLEPYRDGGSGLPVVPMDEIADKVERAHAAGISSAIHAIGDRAIRELLDVFSEVLPRARASAGAQPLAPHRIEHVQHSHPEDLRRLGELGLVASVQPIHMEDDIGLVERAIGDERARWTYAFRTLLDTGAVLALGSDCPVASPNPFEGIHAAVARRRLNGQPAGGWQPEQRLTVAEAVAGYTSGPAYATGLSDRQGSIAPGKLADLVVLDRDIFAVPPADIAATQAVLTVFDGKIVHNTGDIG